MPKNKTKAKHHWNGKEITRHKRIDQRDQRKAEKEDDGKVGNDAMFCESEACRNEIEGDEYYECPNCNATVCGECILGDPATHCTICEDEFNAKEEEE